MKKIKIKIIFLSYEARSGSTYLCSELNKLEKICVSIEDSVPYGISLIQHFVKEKNKLLKFFKNDKKFENWNIPLKRIKEIVAKKDSKYIFEQIVEDYISANKPQAQFFVYKMPIKPIYFKKCLELYPEAKFIHLYRDPRAVYFSQSSNYNSDLKKIFSNNPITFANNWKFNYRFFKNSNNNVLDIQYEKFIRSFDETRTSILYFLGVVDQSTIDSDSYVKKIPTSQLHLHKNINKKPLLEKIDAWKYNLSSREAYLVQKICNNAIIVENYEIVNFKTSNIIDYELLKYYLIHYTSISKKVFSLLINPNYKFSRQIINRIKVRF